MAEERKHAYKPSPKEVLEFLGHDFGEAFSEKRRLEEQIWDITKFTFTAHGTLIGLAVGLYGYSLDHDTDLIPAVQVILAITLAIGAFLVLLMVRTRIYFVAASRYINEQRRYFLAENLAGYENTTGYYANPAFPYFFGWNSTQIWATLLVAFFNSSVAATLAFLAARYSPSRVAYTIGVLLLCFLLQALLVYRVLSSKEGKKVEDAVFGVRRS